MKAEQSWQPPKALNIDKEIAWQPLRLQWRSLLPVEQVVAKSPSVVSSTSQWGKKSREGDTHDQSSANNNCKPTVKYTVKYISKRYEMVLCCDVSALYERLDVTTLFYPSTILQFQELSYDVISVHTRQ